MEEKSPAQLPFLFPKDLDFECTSCGRCCRDRWEIRVDAPSAEKLLSHDWSASLPELAGAVPFKKRLPLAAGVVESGADELSYTIERRSCGSCVFLTQNNLCTIHSKLGFLEKPQVCQQFPFLFSESKEGVTVGLSHYCPGVRRREGASAPPLLAQEAELRRLHAHALRVERAPERILIDDGLPVLWEDYAAFEAFLRELLIADPRSVPASLGSLAVASAMLADFLRVRAAGKDEPPAGAVRDFVAGWKRMGPARIVEIARRQRRAPRTVRILLRQFLSLVDVGGSDAGTSLGRALRGFWAFVKEALGVGSAHCLPLDARVSIRAVRGVELPWESPELSEPLRRYADHAIFRRRLLPILGARVGLALLVLHVAAARYVARAQAVLAGRERATPDDVATGIQLVEKHYATHSRLGEAFARGPARGLFRKIAARPRYALAILER
ncbi:YkgJ family cysteine cluster protein [bacterium]|nr:YkgJ family cysteine cluster protein [bacterium]